MTEQQAEPFQAQATRSFGDYVQGAWYSIDPADGQLMALLGAGYFDTEGNDNLTTERFTYHAGEVVAPANVGIHGTMAEQEHINVEAGYQPANDVQVPAKATGTQRATTADTETEATSGEVGSEPGADSASGQRARSAARKSGNARNG